MPSNRTDAAPRPRAAADRPTRHPAARTSQRSGAATTILAIAVAVTAALGGCAVVQVDADGGHRIVGLVALTVPPPGCTAPGADGLRLRSVGLALTRGALGDTIVLGYQDAAVIVLRDDSLVLLAPPQAAVPPPDQAAAMLLSAMPGRRAR